MQSSIFKGSTKMEKLITFVSAIHLQKCSISTRGALDLLGTLNRNRSLRELDLEGNKISIYVMHSMKKALASSERASANLKYKL
jgi:hypothetical protein